MRLACSLRGVSSVYFWCSLFVVKIIGNTRNIIGDYGYRKLSESEFVKNIVIVIGDFSVTVIGKFPAYRYREISDNHNDWQPLHMCEKAVQLCGNIVLILI